MTGSPGEQDIPVTGFRCTAKTRYRQPDQACVIYKDADMPNGVRVESRRTATCGDSRTKCSVYADEVCLGGGVIHHTNAPKPDFI